jgi:hypothetical protein
MNKNDKRRREILNIKSYGYGSGVVRMAQWLEAVRSLQCGANLF